MPHHLSLTVAGKATRLDRWLAAELPELTRSRLQKLIEGGQVQINGQPCQKKQTVVKVGDQITLEIPPTESLQLEPENLPLDILYEDESLIIINKAAGMVVHPAPGHSGGTLVNGLLYHCQDLAGIGGVERPGIVHRLDRDTTGAMVVAKTDQAHQHLQKQIQTKIAQREYLGVVYGAPRASEGTIDAPIGRHPVDRKKQAIVPESQGGRPAVTHWRVGERLGNFTLLEFKLETGRTHQIRVHSSSMGHPIVGDGVYGVGRSLGVNLTGQALHAYRLIVEHPVSGERIEAIAPPPPEFLTLLEVLRKR
ncbi:RluA family pseudouridine synthase [Spirulina subsalsa]|uniref:RluA family pseudouridine synthase n=1 Tax=Spirulina subsalsa TaxID=54311 RepID=UPI00031ACF7A|nr:RluA family pseudouridine synthase [Spirulina subsalsa]